MKLLDWFANFIINRPWPKFFVAWVARKLIEKDSAKAITIAFRRGLIDRMDNPKFKEKLINRINIVLQSRHDLEVKYEEMMAESRKIPYEILNNLTYEKMIDGILESVYEEILREFERKYKLSVDE